MAKDKTNLGSANIDGKLFSARFVLAIVLKVLGIAWVAWYYTAARNDPSAFPTQISELQGWNYVIGLGLLMLGLVVAAHPSTPLGRGRGVVVGMLFCFLFGLLWICVFYVFSNDLSSIPVFNDLGNWNLVFGIGWMAVGFTYATKWE
ncbi:cell division protein CrgA [Nocardioides limicola]|uniref:cell division protein CrgA n=1 Tax=Nocardioides limicola TaxID=2803368 RepID=UPI00193B61E6